MQQSSRPPSTFSSRLLRRLGEGLLLPFFEGMPWSMGRVLRRWVYRPFLASMGQAVDIKPGVELVNVSGITLADAARLERGVRIRNLGSTSQVVIGPEVILDRGVDIRSHSAAYIEIGRKTYIGPYTCLSGNFIKVGHDCLIASHSGIYANNHNFQDPVAKIREQGHTYLGVVIEDDCWLGTGCRVLDGVTIGKGSVVGAGAVVTKSLPPYSIAVGVPAKIIGVRNKDHESISTPPSEADPDRLVCAAIQRAHDTGSEATPEGSDGE